jgi:hypothetical protein
MYDVFSLKTTVIHLISYWSKSLDPMVVISYFFTIYNTLSRRLHEATGLFMSGAQLL